MPLNTPFLPKASKCWRLGPHQHHDHSVSQVLHSNMLLRSLYVCVCFTLKEHTQHPGGLKQQCLGVRRGEARLTLNGLEAAGLLHSSEAHCTLTLSHPPVTGLGSHLPVDHSLLAARLEVYVLSSARGPWYTRMLPSAGDMAADASHLGSPVQDSTPSHENHKEATTGLQVCTTVHTDTLCWHLQLTSVTCPKT